MYRYGTESLSIGMGCGCDYWYGTESVRICMGQILVVVVVFQLIGDFKYSLCICKA